MGGARAANETWPRRPPRSGPRVSEPTGVRITLATPKADLLASVWPNVSVIYCPRVESASQVQALDVMVGHLERLTW